MSGPKSGEDSHIFLRIVGKTKEYPLIHLTVSLALFQPVTGNKVSALTMIFFVFPVLNTLSVNPYDFSPEERNPVISRVPNPPVDRVRPSWYFYGR